MSNRWESQLHVVVARPYPDCPVYRVRLEGKDGPRRILNDNSLRPCLTCLAPRAAENTERQASETNESLAVWGFALPFNPVETVGEAQAPELRRSQREKSVDP